MDQPSADLQRIQRWEQAGGEWRVVGEHGSDVTVSLMRCDAGEEIDRLVSGEVDVRSYVGLA